MKWENHGRAKAKVPHYKSSDTILDRWIKAGHKEAKLIRAYRKLGILQKTFVGYEEERSGLWQHKDKQGRVHPQYFTGLADTGRSKCRAPNLQNQVNTDRYEPYRNIKPFHFRP